MESIKKQIEQNQNVVKVNFYLISFHYTVCSLLFAFSKS